MAVTEKPVTSDSTWTLGGEPWMSVWPTIESELRKVVWRRIPSEFDVDDVLQEVCARMLGSRKELADVGEAVRYATTVACNYVRDLHRRRSRSFPAECFERTSQDVERAVLARLRFQALEERVMALGSEDRQAFADPQGDASLKSGAMRVRRSRVRARLAASIKGAVGGGFALPRLRWFLVPASTAALLVPALPVLPGVEAEGAAEAAPASAAAPYSIPLLQGSSDPGVHPATNPKNGLRTSSSPATRHVDQRGRYTPDQTIEGPMGAGAEAGRWDPPTGKEEQPLLCVSGVNPKGDVCTPPEAHPRNVQPPK